MGREKRGGLEKYLMNFSRGTRACVGIGYAIFFFYIFICLLPSSPTPLTPTGFFDSDFFWLFFFLVEGRERERRGGRKNGGEKEYRS